MYGGGIAADIFVRTYETGTYETGTYKIGTYETGTFW